MLALLSGRFPVAQDRGDLQGQTATIQVKREEGADHHRLSSVRNRAAEVEGEKRTNTRHV